MKDYAGEPAIAELAASARFVEVDFKSPGEYNPCNPSIARNDDGELWMIQRSVNYCVVPEGWSKFHFGNGFLTRNHFLRLGSDFSVLSCEEIENPEFMPEPLSHLAHGFEDCRLFFQDNQPWCSATICELNETGRPEIALCRIGRRQGILRITEFEVIIPAFHTRRPEKNWMPVLGGKVHWLYSCNPVRLINRAGHLVSSIPSPDAHRSWNGGSPLVPFDGGYLAVVHEHRARQWKPLYLHRFVWFNPQFDLQMSTKPFFFQKLGVEFACGLVFEPERGRLIVSFGIDDHRSVIGTFAVNEIRGLLAPVREASEAGAAMAS